MKKVILLTSLLIVIGLSSCNDEYEPAVNQVPMVLGADSMGVVDTSE